MWVLAGHTSICGHDHVYLCPLTISGLISGRIITCLTTGALTTASAAARASGVYYIDIDI